MRSYLLTCAASTVQLVGVVGFTIWLQRLVPPTCCSPHASSSPGLKAAPVFERQLGSTVLWQHAVPCHLPSQELHSLLLAPLHQLIAEPAAADPAIPSADVHLHQRPTKLQAMSSLLSVAADGVVQKGCRPCQTLGCRSPKATR